MSVDRNILENILLILVLSIDDVNIVDISADFTVVKIRKKFTLSFRIEEIKNVLVFVTRKMCDFRLTFIIDKHVDFQIAENRKLNGLFNKALLPLTEANFTLIAILDPLDLLKSSFAHSLLFYVLRVCMCMFQ